MRIKKKRLSHRVLLSLPTELYQTISRLSQAMEKPRAEVIREMLEEQQLMLLSLATALEEAKEGHKEKAAQAIQKMAGNALIGLGEMMSSKRRKVRSVYW